MPQALLALTSILDLKICPFFVSYENIVSAIAQGTA